MTSEERAERIIGLTGWTLTPHIDAAKWLAREIRAAVEEYEIDAFRRGKAIAYEDAAKIADNCDDSYIGERIAADIRARTKEIK